MTLPSILVNTVMSKKYLKFILKVSIHLSQVLENEEPGAVTTLVFGKDSELFASSALYMGLIICMIAILGTIYEVIRWIRFRYKVNSQSRCKSFFNACFHQANIIKMK